MAEEDTNPSGRGSQRAGEDLPNETGRRGGNADDVLPEVRLPELPSTPTLPDAPILKPNLPKLTKPNQAAEEYRQMGIAYTLPAMLVAPILLLTLIGYWLDGHFNKSPAFTLGGALLGAVTGFINLIRTASKLNR
jgi:F0F1-type ATP synthase assembly protein I